LHITGHVQGVFFRACTQEKAREFGLNGWVRNCSDGSVEVHAEGEEDAIKELEKWCIEGPPSAEVKDVMMKEVEKEGCGDFEVRY
jgi:acylphosphatase